MYQTISLFYIYRTILSEAGGAGGEELLHATEVVAILCGKGGLR